MNNPSLICQAYAFATVVLWSTAYVYTKVALAFFTPGPLGLVRCAVASIAFLVVLPAMGRGHGGFFVPAARHLPLFAASGLSGFTLYLLAFNEGSISLNPTTNCIVISTAPILTAALARMFFGERLPVLRWVALALAFGGVVVMNGGGSGFVLAPGMGWVLVAAVLLSLYNVVQRTLARHYGAVQIAAWSFFAGTLFLLYCLPQAVAEMRAAPAHALWLVLLLGIFPSAAAYLLWTRALSLAPRTSLVTNYMFLTPFLSMLLDFAVTGGLPGASTFAGGAIILGALLMFSVAGQRARKA